MAKITDLKFEINGLQYVVHVNCTSSGLFTANIPSIVAEALSLRAKIETTTLQLLEKDINGAIDRYKAANTKEELFILIKYASNGRYTQKSDGMPLFTGYNNQYELQVGGFYSQNIHAVGFQFKVCIKQTIDTVENWFNAQLGKDFAHFQDERSEPDKYFKYGKMSHPEYWKIIPYSPESLATLQVAQEKIRQLSELLYDFVSQDEKQIEQYLKNQKLLT